MATSDAEICNIALGRIGQGQFISALGDPGTEAEACTVFYGTARDALLELVPWPFAETYADLAALDPDIYEIPGWDFVYTLPTDCVAARYLWAGVEEPPEEQRIPFGLKRLASVGKVLVTNQEDAVLVYTARVVDVLQYPPTFVDALAWRLAVDLTMRIPVKPQTALAMQVKAQAALEAAGAASFRQSQASSPPASRAIRART